MGGGKKSKAPKAPNYAAAAREQGAADKATAQYTSAMDRPTQEDPYGRVTWEFTGADRNNPQAGDWKQTTWLNQPEQQIFEQEQRNRLGLENLAATGINKANTTIDQGFNPKFANFQDAQGLAAAGREIPTFEADRSWLPNYVQDATAPGMQADNVGLTSNTLAGMQDMNESADQFGAQGEQVRDAMYQQMTRFNDERFGKAENAERTRLAQMGLQEGTEAYKNALSEFNRSKDESYQGAMLNSILAGGQEQSRMVGDQLASRASNIGLRQGQFGQGMSLDQQDMAERLQNYGAASNQYGQNQGERQFGFNADLARNQMDLDERMAAFNTGAQAFGMDQSERQAQATSQLNIANQAAAKRQQTFDEQAYMNSLPINQLSALLGGGGVQMPQFASFAPSTPFAAPDTLGATQAQYNAKMGAANSAQAGKGNMLGAGASMFGSYMGGK